MSGKDFALFLIIISLTLMFIFLAAEIEVLTDVHRKLVKSVFCIDGWGITHILLYSIFGYCFPGNFNFFLSLGIGWEIIEELLGKYRPVEIKTISNSKKSTSDSSSFSDSSSNSNYWYGRSVDIFCNISGYLFGQYIKSIN